MILLSSLCYGAAISVFFAALSSFVTYRVVIKNCYKSDEYVKKIAGWRVDEVLNKWLDDCKIYDKLNFLEGRRKSLENAVDKNKNDIDALNKIVVNYFEKQKSVSENFSVVLKEVSEKYKKLIDKISKIKIVFD